MQPAASAFSTHRPRAHAGSGWSLGRFWRMVLAAVLIGLASWPLLPHATAGEPALRQFELQRADDGLLLSYALDFDLPRGAEEALNKAVPLYFVAEAEVYRERWYWRDKQVAGATRTWRVVFQPLTFTYRVSFGGLSQSYGSRAEALDAIRRGLRWKIAEPGQLEDGSRHYVEFNFRLDTSQLPRPMQIGIGGQPDWTLQVERFQRLE